MFDDELLETKPLLSERECNTIADELFARMEDTPVLAQLFDAYGIVGGIVLYRGKKFKVDPIQLRIGFTESDVDRHAALARKAMERPINPMDSRLGRTMRTQELWRQGAASLSGGDLVMGAVLPACQKSRPLEPFEALEIEDMAELFLVALSRELRERLQVHYLPRHARDFLKRRYEPHLLEHFHSFL